MYVRMYVYTYNIDTMLLNGLQLLHTYKLLGSSKPPWGGSFGERAWAIIGESFESMTD